GDNRGRCSQSGAGPDADVEARSRGAGGDGERSWRAAVPAPIVGNGSGTEVSSLTADYQRSRGCGTEEASGSPGVGAEHPPRWPSSPSPFREPRLFRLQDERPHPEPLDDQVGQNLVPDFVAPLLDRVRGLVRWQRQTELDQAPADFVAFLSRGGGRLGRPRASPDAHFPHDDGSRRAHL